MNYPAGHEKVNRGDIIQKDWLFFDGTWRLTECAGAIPPYYMVKDYCRPIEQPNNEQPNKEKPMLVLELKTIAPDYLPDITCSDKIALFKIVKQEGFGYGAKYAASNGLTISSINFPCYCKSDFFIRGEKKDFDDTVIAVTNEEFAKISAAVKEILERENAPKFLETITFFHVVTNRRYKVNVISNNGTNIVCVDCDTKEKSIVLVSNLRDIQTLPNAF